MDKRRIMTTVAGALLAGCSFAPTYHVPSTTISAAYKEAGSWQVAQPSDRIERDSWWKVYHDPELDRLEPLVATANPDVQAAVARHDEAIAYEHQAESSLYPTLGADAQVTRNRQSERRPLRFGAVMPSSYDANLAELAFDYDLDLWGKVRNEVAASKAQSEAAADDLGSLRLSLQANLAEAYWRLRGLDEQAQVLADTIDTYRRALRLTVSRRAGGISSDLDVSRAQTQLAAAKAQAEDVKAQRALEEHAIAALTGTSASTFALNPSDALSYLPSVPAGMPGTLLERRPDVAAAERRVAAANAQIGVARAAYFPDISLGIAGGFESDKFSPWFAAPEEMWSLGPTLAQTLFDGGLRRAKTAEARAQLAQYSANYRSTVIKAIQQVEDNLALEHHLGDEAMREDEALDASKHTLDLSMSQYRDGVVSYLDVVTAQTTELQTQLVTVSLQTRRLLATVGLIEALGGGWNAPSRVVNMSP
ncbi:efflux transporter outer membrane subunit [Paraburkholderia panacisoli]|uniref:Efflux transporter outer membrane subunit n=1 Tax=Paraburkholderia panacisoli TaxID=2603818 RepID=A0A5B0GJ31_9BURK|nr:efflux transporter outer membrane subunit [Paraburkholderia panacisoli]KAA1003386.1 efflux transporter outer membrane subunit [Paraburkholderia panacisoli]